MKKMFMAVLTCILVSFSAVGLAARFDTCALLIADADMKTEDFMNKVSDCLKESPNVVFGTKIQTKYQEYWFEKGELEEGKITLESTAATISACILLPRKLLKNRNSRCYSVLMKKPEPRLISKAIWSDRMPLALIKF